MSKREREIRKREKCVGKMCERYFIFLSCTQRLSYEITLNHNRSRSINRINDGDENAGLLIR